MLKQIFLFPFPMGGSPFLLTIHTNHEASMRLGGFEAEERKDAHALTPLLNMDNTYACIMPLPCIALPEIWIRLDWIGWEGSGADHEMSN